MGNCRRKKFRICSVPSCMGNKEPAYNMCITHLIQWYSFKYLCYIINPLTKKMFPYSSIFFLDRLVEWKETKPNFYKLSLL